MTDLNILDLLSPQYSVIHWTALLIEHRSFRKDSAVAVGGVRISPRSLFTEY